MILLALPGSTYICQGDELGLHEVADLPREALEDPMASRSTKEKGRDGCRVPLPWIPEGPSYGFSEQAAHLPQPNWFRAYAVDVQEADPHSTLNLYRRALPFVAACSQATISVGSIPNRRCCTLHAAMAYGA